MSNYTSQQPYSPPPGAPPSAPPAKKNCFRKGLGFVPCTISRTDQDPIAQLLKAAPTITKGQFSTAANPELLYESEATIPLFDLEQMATAEGENRRELIDSYGLALSQTGFIGIKVDNLSPLVNSVYREMEKYFRQPFDMKLLDWKKENVQRGFSYRGCETGPKAPRPDFKESFFVTSNFSEWPQNMPSFGRCAGELHSVLSEVNNYLMAFLMEYLQNPEDADPGFANHVLRLAYYPAFKPGDDPEGIWSAPHKDKNALSILTKGTVPGLQYYSRKGLWEPVVVPEGYLIVNSGLLLQHKTAGVIQARWHRVVNPGGKYTRLERQSCILYGTWSEDYPLRPFANCLEKATRAMSPQRKKEFLEKYPDITVSEKLSQRSLYLV